MKPIKKIKNAFSDAISGKKSLLAVILPVCVAIVILCTGVSFAWYAINRQTDSLMSFKATVTPNMVISIASSVFDDVEDKYTTDDATFSVDFTDSNTHKFLPCTHDSSVENTGLKYLVNTGYVDSTTGLVNGTDPVFGKVTNSDTQNGIFYMEYTVYIASAGTALSTLKASLTTATYNTKDTKSYNAASVDFYVGGVYKGTLNVAGKDAATNNGTATKTELELASSVPVAGESSYLTVTMRFYFDGALLESSSAAYVNSDTVSKENVSFGVSFTATES